MHLFVKLKANEQSTAFLNKVRKEAPKQLLISGTVVGDFPNRSKRVVYMKMRSILQFNTLWLALPMTFIIYGFGLNFWFYIIPALLGLLNVFYTNWFINMMFRKGLKKAEYKDTIERLTTEQFIEEVDLWLKTKS